MQNADQVEPIGTFQEIVIDSECNGLLPFVDTIWVVCVLDRQTKEVLSFTERGEFLRFLDKYKPKKIIGHSIIGYDLLVFRKVWHIPFTVGRQDTFNGNEVEFVDTFLLSMYLNPDRQGHGLEPFGERLKFLKTSYDDWSGGYCEEMEARCENDVRLNDKVYDYLMREVENYING